MAEKTDLCFVSTLANAGVIERAVIWLTDENVDENTILDEVLHYWPSITIPELMFCIISAWISLSENFGPLPAMQSKFLKIVCFISIDLYWIEVAQMHR